MRNMLCFSLLLAIGGCVVPGDDTATRESDVSVYQWTDDVRIPSQASPYQVGLATYGGKLHMLHTAGSSNRLAWSTFNGATWTAPVLLDLYGDGEPALAAWNNQLVAVYHATGQNRLLMSRYAGAAWSAPVTAGASLDADTLSGGPSLAVHDGALYAAYCVKHDGGHVRVDRLGAGGWTTIVDHPVALFSCRHAAIAELPSGQLDVVYMNNAAELWELFTTGPHNTVWTERSLSMYADSEHSQSIVSCGGVTHLVHSGHGNPDEIWWSHLENGKWSADSRVPDQESEGGAALACLGTTAIMVHDGGYADLWWSEFGP